MITDPEEKKRLWGRSYEDVPSGVFEFSINAGWGFGRTSSLQRLREIIKISTCQLQAIPPAPDSLGASGLPACMAPRSHPDRSLNFTPPPHFGLSPQAVLE